MVLTEKKEALIRAEWEAFQQVQNQGGRASCQDDPDTFFIMRRSQFVFWPEELVDSYAGDLARAKAAGRNLLAEKYAWMMESTAPEEFVRIRHLLPEISEWKEIQIHSIVAMQLTWMEEYRRRYPVLASGNRATYSCEDTPYQTSFETYLRGELHTYSDDTLELYLRFMNGLREQGENLSLKTMEVMVQSYGYRDLEDAESRLGVIEEKQ